MPITPAHLEATPDALDADTIEGERIRVLRSYGVLDTAPEAAFDGLVRLAAALCGTPVATVTLVDRHRQWFKARVGIDNRETDRSVAFCDLTIRQRGVLVIPDTATDPRAAGRAGPPTDRPIRFYAGVPLVTSEGVAIGALCVSDHEPRTLTDAQVDSLQVLARQAMDQLELRRQGQELKAVLADRDRAHEELRRMADHLAAAQQIAATGSWEHDLVTDAIFWSEEVYRIFGVADASRFTPSLTGFLAFVHPDDRASLMTAQSVALANGTPLDAIHRIIRPDGAIRYVRERAEMRTTADGRTALAGTVQDITEQHDIESALRQSEERFVAAARATSDTLWDWDLRTDALWWDESFASHFGAHASDDPTIATWTRRIHPDDHARVVADVEAAVSAGEVWWQSEYRFMRGDGTYAWVLDRGTVFRDLEGNAVRMIGGLTDLSERRDAEAATRASEARLRMLAETVQDVFWVVDQSTRKIEYVSPRYADLFDQPVEALLSDPKAYQRRVYPEDLPVLMDALARDATSLDIEYRVLHRTGEVRWVRVQTFPVRDADGTVRRSVGTARDITTLRAVTDQLRTSEAQYRLLFDGNPQPMWVYELSSLRIVAVNRAACARYGYAEEEFRTMTLLDLRPEDEVERLRSVMQQLQVTGGTSFGLWRHRTRDGTILDVEVTSDAITFDGRPARLVLASDVTERRRLEAQLLRAQRLESLGTLAGGIAHDLNNVLAPILMSIEGLREADLGTTETATIDLIESSARRGAELVQQVLTFARGAPGRRDAIDVATIVGELARFVRDTFDRKITLAVEVAADTWPVTGDPVQLHQVLLNLCVNSRDAMPAGGTLTLGVANTSLDAAGAALRPGLPPGDYVVLRVTDTGTGIPESIRPMVFDPFFTTKDVGRGTGLGLATVMGIVKGHGGTVEIRSTMGVGTVFEVYLPATRAVAQPVASAGSPALPRGLGETILVVDDDDAVRRAMQRTLERYGYTVVTAIDGGEAVHTFETRPGSIDLVITDMMMPILDGPGTIRALRAIDPTVRIIAATGLVSPDTQADLLDAGVRHILPKPYTAVSLLTGVRQALIES